MTADVIRLPRPRQARTGQAPLAFFVRVGFNDHREMLELITAGERSLFGFVIDAPYAERHRELIEEARRREFDLILDPKTQPMGFQGSHNERLAALPWGLERHHQPSDFAGVEGRGRAEQVVEFARTHGFTQVLGPTHLLGSPNDRWLRRDIEMMGWTHDSIRASGGDLGLVYSLAVPLAVLRDRDQRRALVSALADAPCDTIWLKVENFGDDASGEKSAAYVEACRDFHARGLPLVADHVGGLPGLGVLAFGAVGGIAHGVTVQQNFKAGTWRRPPLPRPGGGQPRRVYLPSLDMMMKPPDAQAFLAISNRVRSLHACRDTRCCPANVGDMIRNPARHALYQRAREIEGLSATPQTVRPGHYLDRHVRPVSDAVAAAAALPGLVSGLQTSLAKKQRHLGGLRRVMATLADASPPESVADPPLRRSVRVEEPTGRGRMTNNDGGERPR